MPRSPDNRSPRGTLLEASPKLSVSLKSFERRGPTADLGPSKRRVVTGDHRSRLSRGEASTFRGGTRRALSKKEERTDVRIVSSIGLPGVLQGGSA